MDRCIECGLIAEICGDISSNGLCENCDADPISSDHETEDADLNMLLGGTVETRYRFHGPR